MSSVTALKRPPANLAMERILSRSALVRMGWSDSSRMWESTSASSRRFGRGPIIETRLMTNDSRMESIGGFVTCANRWRK